MKHVIRIHRNKKEDTRNFECRSTKNITKGEGEGDGDGDASPGADAVASPEGAQEKKISEIENRNKKIQSI